MSSITTRRDFLKTTATWGIGAGFALDARLYGRIVGANGRLAIGVIGVAGRGSGNLQGVSSENIVALCDVDKNQLDRAAKRFSEAKRFLDYRELIELSGIDAVVISTPDHQHAPSTMRALRKGLHVYCEKPLTHTVHEARQVAKMARKMKVATQMGTQYHQHASYLRTVELIKSGAIGAVSEVHVITDRPGGWWKQGLNRPKATQGPPDHIEWDLWLGPAPQRPYHKAYVPFRWRGWWDFGCGAIGDMAIHLMDPAVWALDLGGHPVTVSTEGPEPLSESGPTWMKATFEFGTRGSLPPCKLHWYEGTAKPAETIRAELPMNGSLFIGEKGRIAVEHGKKAVLLPKETFKGFKDPKPFLPRSPGHHKQWIEACKSGKPAGSNFDYAGPFAEMVLLGNVAYRTGKTIRWDPVAMKARGVPEAEGLIRKKYRKGWEL